MEGVGGIGVGMGRIVGSPGYSDVFLPYPVPLGSLRLDI